MDWIAHYNKITVSPEEAVRIVDSGDRVYLDPSVNSFIPNALAARSAELSDVRIMFQGPFEHQDWWVGDIRTASIWSPISILGPSPVLPTTKS